MNKKNGAKLLWLLFICLAALLCAPVHAFNPQPDPPKKALGFGMVGLVTGQTMRINIVNYGGPDTRPCEVEILIYGANGNVLARDTAMVEPGQAVSSDFQPTVGAAPRVQARAAVRGIINPEVRPACRNLRRIVPTLEVFDDISGRTSLFLVPASRLFVTDVDD